MRGRAEELEWVTLKMANLLTGNPSAPSAAVVDGGCGRLGQKLGYRDPGMYSTVMVAELNL